MTTEALEQRLRHLTVAAPDAGRITARVLSAVPPSRSNRTLRIAVAPAVLAALTALVVYFVPAAGIAVAEVPLAGDLLRDAGLLAVHDRITSVGSSSSSSGYTVTLVGAYADSTRTVLLVNCRPAAVTLGPDATLTDQFGRTYNAMNGTGDSLSGENVLEFEPLAWPISITGARITLHMSTIETSAAATGEVSGSWTLTGTLGLDESAALAPPGAATLGDAHFTFKSVTYTPASIEIQLDETGVSFEQLGRIVPDGLKGRPAFEMNVFDPSGANITGGASMSDDFLGVVHIKVVAFRVGGRGDYTLRITYSGESFERVLTIP